MQLKIKPIIASFAALALLLAPALSRADGLLQNGDTSHPITLFAASTSDGQTGVAGLTLTVTISKNGGAFAAPTGTVAPIGGGFYAYTPSAADVGTDGELVVNASASGAYINPERRRIIAVNPDDPALFGLTGVGTLAGQNNIQAATNSNGVTLALIKSGQILGTGSVTAATTPTATAFSTTLTATPDLISGDGLVFTSGVNAGKNIHVLTNSAGLFGLPGTGLPAAPSVGDTFVLIPFSKALTNFTAALGSDSRVQISSTDTQAQAEAINALTAQGYTVIRSAKLDNLDTNVASRLPTTGYTAPTAFPADYQQRGVAVTLPSTAPSGYGSTGATPTVSQIAAAILKTPANLLATDTNGNVGTNNFPATVSLSSGDEAKIGSVGTDTPGVTALLGRPAQTGDTFGLVSPLIASGKFTAAALSNVPTAPSSAAPSDYLNASEKAQLASASTAQQAGQPVTLPSTVLSAADLAAVQQAIMTYALHTGVSYQRAVASIYLNTAGASTPTKSGTVQTNPFSWPDGTVGLTSAVNSATGQRIETPGTLPN